MDIQGAGKRELLGSADRDGVQRDVQPGAHAAVRSAGRYRRRIRQQKLASVFGELGGVWHLTSAGSGTVDATISGNVFTAVVNGDGGAVGRSGWVTVKVCNGGAAGKTSSGLELAATLH